MNDSILFFDIISRKAIWGGTKIRSYFGYDSPDDTGQVWAFSAEKNASTLCIDGIFKGKTLLEIWTEAPELFESAHKKFPFIISLVAPVEDLSIQNHPTSHLAKKAGYDSGKDEAWYILDAPGETSLVYGTEVSEKVLVENLKAEKFDGLFRVVPTKTGDFFFIPAGTIHALGKDNITYEVQQSTDLTYRIYDYDRKDEKGNKRALHLDKAIASIEDSDPRVNTSDDFIHPEISRLLTEETEVTVEEYVNCDAFVISKITVNGKARLKKSGYWLTTVISGTGTINGNTKIEFADNFIIPATMTEVVLVGNFCLMITSEKRILQEN